MGTNRFNSFKDLTKNSAKSFAFYDLSYSQRRDYCRDLARDNEINFILDTICNEAINEDENGYIAQLDLDRLKLFLNKSYSNTKTGSNADVLIRDCKVAYNNIYTALGWDANNGGWSYFKQLLIDGFIALEILIDENSKSIVGFLDIDPLTLEPGIVVTEDGKELFIWYQYKGEQRERRIPDSNIIYISWNNMSQTRSNNISYVEGLTRSFNMLRQLEHSQLIWNIQNAQKRMKITVPVGSMTPQRAEAKISQLMADYNEEVSMDGASGQMLVNGEPKFNFQKTYVFEDRDGASVNIEEIATEGYNMTTTESLQYFWRKFILESQVPANRFMQNISSAPANAFLGDSNITREEYAFGRFIQRLRSVFKEVLVKPLWVQICLTHPELSQTNYIKQGLGIIFNEENMFILAKKRAIIADGANTVSTLLGIVGTDQQPYFSIDYLVKEYLGLSDQDLEINRKYKEAEILHNIEIAKLQKKHAEDKLAATPAAQGGSAEGDFGGAGGGDFGGGFGGDTGGDVMGGGEFGGGSEPAAPEPAPDAGGDEGF